MDYNLAIDSDSILYTSCYHHQNKEEESCNLELAYMDFLEIVSKTKSKVWSMYDIQSEDNLFIHLIFSPKKTFRNKLTDTYKANRKESGIVGIGELKQLVKERLPTMFLQIENLEADDIVITMAYEKENVVIACIDKDIKNHSPVDCIDYKKWEWKLASTQEEIEKEYWIQALMGDSTDGIKGAKGIGAVKARELVSREEFDYDLYIKQFESEDDAILSMRLVRLDQFKKGELVLWENK